MRDDKCNGWTNWHTWNMHLWLTNDEAIYRWVKDAKNVRLLRQDADRFGIDDGIDYDKVNWSEIFKALQDK